MSNDTSGHTTKVTRYTENRDSGEVAMMSYTAVTTHQSMAESFVRELLRLSQKIIPDHDLTIEDLYSVCHIALDRKDRGAVMLEGRHLRGRIGEQFCRTERYKEAFSILVIKLEDEITSSSYDAVIDTLCERMRRTDLMFLFKYRIVLILPHTIRDACETLCVRIKELLVSAIVPTPRIDTAHLTCPNPKAQSASDVMDWAEDQLRI